jgi:hypothetical protein
VDNVARSVFCARSRFFLHREDVGLTSLFQPKRETCMFGEGGTTALDNSPPRSGIKEKVASS